MSFRVFFWNIEDFVDHSQRVSRVADHILATAPDVLGFAEIRDKQALRRIMRDHLDAYDFAVTDGQQEVELAVGWRRGLFEQALFTQRREFKAFNPDLRPGALISLRQGGENFHVLFLHADSGRKVSDFENRQEVFRNIWSLKAALDRTEGHPARLVVMGDLNTMGHDPSKKRKALHGRDEVRLLDRDANRNGMNLLSKSHGASFLQVNDGKIIFDADLDHVLVSQDLKLDDAGSGARVRVRGWVDAADDAGKIDFIDNVSDHASVEIVVKSG